MRERGGGLAAATRAGPASGAEPVEKGNVGRADGVDVAEDEAGRCRRPGRGGGGGGGGSRRDGAGGDFGGGGVGGVGEKR